MQSGNELAFGFYGKGPIREINKASINVTHTQISTSSLFGVIEWQPAPHLWILQTT